MSEECLFCGIIEGKIPSARVTEDENSLAFLDINPRNPGHTLVIPKKHFETLLDMPDEEAGKLFKSVKMVAAAVKEAMQADGISIGQSNGQAAGQVVAHVHFHIIPRFANEGPASMESILGVKKMPENAMQKIANTIADKVGSEKRKSEAEKKIDDFDF